MLARRQAICTTWKKSVTASKHLAPALIALLLACATLAGGLGASGLGASGLGASGLGAAAQSTYLSDALKRPKYRGAWNAMMKGWAAVPTWLVEFSKTNDGVATPGTSAEVGGKTYEFFALCKPHDCAANKFEVMFEKGGARAHAILVTPNARTFFGDPGAAEKEALAKAVAE